MSGASWLRAQGVTTIINLRSPEEMQRQVNFDEAALAKELGMNYVWIPMRGNAEFPYDPAGLAKFTKAINQADGSVLLAFVAYGRMVLQPIA